MSSPGGNAVSYWRQLRQLLQVRNYLLKSYPVTSEQLQNTLAVVLKFTKTKSIEKETDVEESSKHSTDVEKPCKHSKKEVKSHKVLNQREKNKLEKSEKKSPSPTKPNESYKSSYSEIKKAFTSINAYIPQLPYSFYAKEAEPSTPVKLQSETNAPPKWMIKKKTVVSRGSIDSRTRHLVKGLESGLSSSVSLRRIEDLCDHLKKYPETRGIAIKYSGVSRLLRILHHTKEVSIMEIARETLALIGYTQPVKGHGIRILSIDGGGTRGLVALNILRHFESKTGKRIHELFDFVCGVSTGAVIAVLLGAHRLSLNASEKLYRDISTQIFSQTTFRGTASLVWKNSFYDSSAWTEILRKEMGEVPMIETTRTHEMNKLCLVSTQANDNWVKAFVFRNYNFPYRMASHFTGSSSARLWEGVRASAAAPGYFSEFKLDDLHLLDGGVMVNNPTAIAIHEARQLWPDTPFQSVVSIGTGRHEPLEVERDASINWTSKIKTFINSATDTEGVHVTLHDLLPGNVYFRFNPYLSEALYLDEIRQDKIATMLEDTNLYLRKNEAKIDDAIESLNKPKTMLDAASDYISLKKLMWSV